MFIDTLGGLLKAHINIGYLKLKVMDFCPFSFSG